MLRGLHEGLQSGIFLWRVSVNVLCVSTFPLRPVYPVHLSALGLTTPGSNYEDLRNVSPNCGYFLCFEPSPPPNILTRRQSVLLVELGDQD
jgi:hypothetical protein